jgi:hypothetical protein
MESDLSKGENREDDPKTCWKCGYKIASGSVCPMCGSVNKESALAKADQKMEMMVTEGVDQSGQKNSQKPPPCGHALGGEVCGESKSETTSETARKAAADVLGQEKRRDVGPSTLADPGDKGATLVKQVKSVVEPMRDVDIFKARQEGGRRFRQDH